MKISRIDLRCRNIQVLALAALLLLGAPFPASGEVLDSILRKEMTQQEVLRELGGPLEKIERETRREELWYYKEIEIEFHEGKLFAWGLRNANGRIVPSTETAGSGDSRKAADDDAEASVMREILGEIMNSESGEGAEGAAKGKPGEAGKGK